MEIKPVPQDGNCLFSAILKSVNIDKIYHKKLRVLTCRELMKSSLEDKMRIAACIEDESNKMSDEEKFNYYIDKMKKDGEFGTHFELNTIGKAIKCKITVHITDQTKNLNNMIEACEDGNYQLYLALTQGRNGAKGKVGHYDAVVIQKQEKEIRENICNFLEINESNAISEEYENEKKVEENINFDDSKEKKMDIDLESKETKLLIWNCRSLNDTIKRQYLYNPII